MSPNRNPDSSTPMIPNPPFPRRHPTARHHEVLMYLLGPPDTLRFPRRTFGSCPGVSRKWCNDCPLLAIDTVQVWRIVTICVRPCAERYASMSSGLFDPHCEIDPSPLRRGSRWNRGNKLRTQYSRARTCASYLRAPNLAYTNRSPSRRSVV